VGETIFVGRDREMTELHGLLQGNDRVAIAAVGMSGVGKTTLARHYVMLYRTEYPGGVWWLSAAQLVLEMLGYVDRMELRSELPTNYSEVQIVQHYFDRWEREFGDRKLLVIDDVTDYGLMKAFLPQQGTFQVLMTTKVKFGKPVKRLDLAVLEPEAALLLLRSHVADDAKFTLAIPAAKELCEWLGYLPLAIELVGRYLAETGTIAGVLAQLKAKSLAARAIAGKPEEMEYEYNVRAAIELSWEPLSEAARWVAMVLGVFGLAPIELDWVRACVDDEDVEEVLDLELVKRSLVEQKETGYRLHSLVREFLREKLAATENAKAVRLRCANVMNAVLIQYKKEGQYLKAIPLGEQALEICQTELGDRHPDTATSLNNLAALYRSMGQYDRALPLYEQALEIRQTELGDRHPDTATSLNNLAYLYESMGQSDRALPLYEQALEIWQTELGDRHPSTAASLNNLAALYRSMGQYDRALPLYEQALEIWQTELGDRHPDTATSLNNLAGLYESMGQSDRALPLYEQALEIRQTELGDRHPDTAASLFNLAALYYNTQQYHQALSFIQQALQIYIPILGEDHPTTQKAKGWLQVIQNQIENHERIQHSIQESAILQAISILEKTLGSTHPITQAKRQELLQLREKMRN
jgi:tetratricopeptide (TPR) repeat protein